MKAEAKGAVAAGHPKTAEAAAEILRTGGNAFDAAVAGLFTATVAEPLLASLGGGGFALTDSPTHGRCVYDFFAHTPQKPGRNPKYFPIEGDFGAARQTFFIGPGTVAMPGMVDGLLTLHADLGRLPLAVCVEHAVDCARSGVEVNAFQAQVANILTPIVSANKNVAQLYGGGPVQAGQTQFFPRHAEVLESLGREAPRWFYEGEAAREIVKALGDGGHLTVDDFAGYQTRKRTPLTFRFGKATVHANPAPACGGIMVAMTLAMYERLRTEGYGKAEALVEAMSRSMTMRKRTRVQEEPGSEPVMESLRALGIELANVSAVKARSQTTHISVVDSDGNLASVTVSNGEGSGCVVPELGMHMNNFLGEEDINPCGVGNWSAGVRMSSMMAPVIMDTPNGRLAIGSGGSERIRTAIAQVIIRLVEDDLPAQVAVDAARFHLEESRLNAEPTAVDASQVSVPVHEWGAPSLYFGGVHVASKGDSELDAAGDPRRGGVGVMV